MTDREIMQMALDALEYPGPSWPDARQKAAEALRAALAQPEQDDGYCQACEGDNCTAKDGCVALDNPPPQREWQELTDEETNEIAREWQETPDGLGDLCRAIEAKLREKNG